VNAAVRYAGGATGVFQASTAFWPGYPERIEFHGTKGTAVISGDKLTVWDVENDSGEPAPVARNVSSGASDPMAISLEPFERQFRDLADAIASGRKPAVAGEEGYQALEVVDAVYRSCRSGQPVRI
jgi:predicted dehydrogenase